MIVIFARVFAPGFTEIWFRVGRSCAVSSAAFTVQSSLVSSCLSMCLWTGYCVSCTHVLFCGPELVSGDDHRVGAKELGTSLILYNQSQAHSKGTIGDFRRNDNRTIRNVLECSERLCIIIVSGQMKGYLF